MKIKYSKAFKKQYAKTPKKIRQAFKNRRNLFLKDSYNHVLNNHKLSGKLKGYRSINITGDWRALYFQFKDIVIFEAIGTHGQLYR
ncbi:type II toxin-antitoxin system YafQ family toxin [Patescibacteria group bacterium]|nr:type II toxin-antitoxin system YafQ family toxin [Patescibacteria group bacterium]MBU1931457.1 type II toxin-antitoxin system YafQ family toxin [Patescibacteria group bacterium]